MEQKNNIDFWSLTDDYDSFDDPIHFLGTYFISFRKPIFLEDFFHSFIANVKSEKTHEEIVYKYEVGLSKLLIEQGKKSYCYFSSKKIGYFMTDNHIELSRKVKVFLNNNTCLSKNKVNNIIDSLFNLNHLNYLHSNKIFFLCYLEFPLIKRRILKSDSFPDETLLYLWKEIVEEFYPKKSEQVLHHCNRINFKLKKPYILNSKTSTLITFLTRTKLIYFKQVNEKNYQYTSVKVLFFKLKYSHNLKKLYIFGVRIF